MQNSMSSLWNMYDYSCEYYMKTTFFIINYLCNKIFLKQVKVHASSLVDILLIQPKRDTNGE